MKTLEYYWSDGTHTLFDDHTIDKYSVITNVKTGRVMAQYRPADGYARANVSHDGKQRTILVGRALASTFLGPPPSVHHTTDHIDRNNTNDTLDNVRWACPSGQAKNRDMPSELKTAFVIVKDGVERTAREWVDVYTKPDGTRYDKKTIQEFSRQQKHGFGYKVFEDFPGEEWKAVQDSKNSQGEWFISTMNRMKYKTAYAENVIEVDQLHKVQGYPAVGIDGKQWLCHVLSMMTFRPEEYAIKRPDYIILHENDNKLDFRPSKLRWGTPSENGTDAHKNGRYDGKRSAQKPVASYVNGAFEKEHESLSDAARYLRENGYPKANRVSVRRALNTGAIHYDRTWTMLFVI